MEAILQQAAEAAPGAAAAEVALVQPTEEYGAIPHCKVFTLAHLESLVSLSLFSFPSILRKITL